MKINFLKLTCYLDFDRFQINVSDFATFQTFLKEQLVNIPLNVKMTFLKLLSAWQVILYIFQLNNFKVRNVYFFLFYNHDIFIYSRAEPCAML